MIKSILIFACIVFIALVFALLIHNPFNKKIK